MVRELVNLIIIYNYIVVSCYIFKGFSFFNNSRNGVNL